ncbi:MAG TPA: T9SS type A sorting domain-containing protein [Chitinophagaceae bacterium]|nr:T9SS type A sorting domain-containing protein [Chitinophagaceae bacterium]
MKKIYLLIGIVCLYAISPQRTQAQCTSCSPGYVVDSIVQEVHLSGILPFNSTVPFNKFDPATGILNCVSTRTTVTTTIEMDLVNRDDQTRVIYSMDYNRSTSLSGPNIAVSSSASRSYGPFDLGQAGVDPDTSVHIGPDVIFSNRVLLRTTTNTTAYNGVGTVNFTYFNNGSFLMTTGNDNYGLDVAAVSDVTIRVVYYFCPLMILSSGMRDLNVSRKNKMVDIRWTTDNETLANRYVVEWSRNGRNFDPVAEIPSNGRGTKTYSYTHDPKGSGKGRIFYRVKQLDEREVPSYTSIQYVTFGDEGPMDPGIYPNPVSDQINISFGSPQTGTVVADLVNITGQTLLSKTWKAAGITSLQVGLNRQYPNGSYWLRIRNTDSGEQVVRRVLISR